MKTLSQATKLDQFGSCGSLKVGKRRKMSDTWTEIQEHKRRQESLRDRLQRRRRERQGIGAQDGDLSGLYSTINATN